MPSSPPSSSKKQFMVAVSPSGGAAGCKGQRNWEKNIAQECELQPSVDVTKAANEWDFKSRPDIHRQDLISDSLLDDRHPTRRVKCVAWRPRTQGGRLHPAKAEKFALKIILRGKTDTHSRRVFNEKDVMLALGESPWHTRLVNTFKSDNNLYMLLEYAPLLSLDTHMDAGRGLRKGGQQAAVFYTACCLNAIEHMHRIGIVHRDIKPGNMLLDADGYLKLCDYGLSKFLRHGETATTLLGTLAYLPPELVGREAYDHSVDLWSLAVSTYEMCYGATPFEPGGLVSNSEWAQVTKAGIMAAKVRLPPQGANLSMRLFLKYMLARAPASRLGRRVGGDEANTSTLVGSIDFSIIRKHSVFSKMSWSDLQERRAVAPLDGSF
jgi:serine/threonine protein kinase